MVLRRCGVWLHDFFCDSFVFISITRFGALVLFLMVALVVRVALRLSGVLLRVALKHRGSVAAGLGCGLWPADSVDCGDCGLAGSAVRGQGGGGHRWHFCLGDRSHTVPRNSPRSRSCR